MLFSALPTASQISRINDVLFHIHQDISQPLAASHLAKVAAYSEQHFHRLFHQVVGEPVHTYIRRVRLEFAANQLMFDTQSSVLDIAEKSGFSSLSSFSKAFKTVFNVPPGAWRKLDKSNKHKPYLRDIEIAQAYERLKEKKLPSMQLLTLPERYVAYVRHQGYGRSIGQAWQILKVWADTEKRDFTQQFGLHHSNPTWVELEQCRYVACIEINQPIQKRSLVNSLTIPGGLHAVFHLTGKYGELLPQLSHILEYWLPQSGFKMQSTPAYVHYHKNQFLTEGEVFDLDFCLPISLY